MRSLVFSDIHANLAALRAVLDAGGRWDEVIFLGDAVVGGPQPDEVLSVLSGLKGIFLLGNHDREALEGEYSESEQNPDRAWIRWTQGRISARNRRFLAGARESCAIERGGLRLRLHHGELPVELGRRLWPDSPPEAWDHFTGRFCEPVILLAHSHVQSRVEHGGRCFVNPGGAGQPRLGRPLACYAVLEDGEFGLEAVPYDAEATARAMDDVPLDREFVKAWKAGYRAGALPARYRLRDMGALRRMGYR